MSATKAERMARAVIDHLLNKAVDWEFDEGADEDVVAAMQAALDAEEPGECPAGYAEEVIYVGTDEESIEQVLAQRRPMGFDEYRWSKVIVRAPLAAPVADLGVVVAKEEG
jgi:hypothetical protein